MTEAQKKAFILADNRLALDTGWDDDLLRVELEALEELGYGLEYTGFDDEELKALFSVTDENEAEDDDFDLDAALDKEAFVQKGDIWEIGRHRLMCGDATDAADVKALMDGAIANMCVTDPPYNCGYEGGTGMKIANDAWSDPNKFYEFLLTAFKNIYAHLADGGAFYCFHSDAEKVNFFNATVDAGFHYSTTCIWVNLSIRMPF